VLESKRLVFRYGRYSLGAVKWLTLAPYLIFLIVSTRAWASTPEQILQRALIVGASVSYGYDPVDQGVQPDPATILITRFNEQDGIVKHAVPGANSSQTLPLMKQSEFDQSTIAIGIDLFFWDSLLSWDDCDAAVDRVAGLAVAVKAKNAPWILGRIPDLGLQQNCMDALNQKIDEVCSQDANCRLIDFEKIIQDIHTQGGLTIYGHFYTPTEIQPDGVHLSAVASEWLADLLYKSINQEPDPYIVYGPSF
jgi:hypothetical protein